MATTPTDSTAIKKKQRPRCGSKLRNRPNEFCASTMLYPNGRCRMHGGKSRGGLDHWHSTTFQRSKFLPTRLVAEFEEHRSNTELVDLRDEVALLKMRRDELLSRLDTEGVAVQWRTMRAAVKQFREAFDSDNPEKMLANLCILEDVASRGLEDYAVWSEVNETTELLRKTVETEAKRQREYSKIAEQMLMLTVALAESVRRNCSNPEERLKIQSDIVKLIGTRKTDQEEEDEQNEQDEQDESDEHAQDQGVIEIENSENLCV